MDWKRDATVEAGRMQFFRELPEGTARRNHTETAGTTKDTKIAKNKKRQNLPRRHGDTGEGSKSIVDKSSESGRGLATSFGQTNDPDSALQGDSRAIRGLLEDRSSLGLKLRSCSNCIFVNGSEIQLVAENGQAVSEKRVPGDKWEAHG